MRSAASVAFCTYQAHAARALTIFNLLRHELRALRASYRVVGLRLGEDGSAVEDAGLRPWGYVRGLRKSSRGRVA